MTQFILIESGGPPEAWSELSRPRSTRLGIVGRFWEDMHAFSATLRYEYKVIDPPKLSKLQVFLAHTIYNPIEEVKGEWVEVGPFEADDVISLIAQGLEEHDDVIQQWFGANDVIRLLKAADSFGQLLVAVDAICGGHELNKETAEYVGSVLGERGQLDS